MIKKGFNTSKNVQQGQEISPSHEIFYLAELCWNQSRWVTASWPHPCKENGSDLFSRENKCGRGLRDRVRGLMPSWWRVLSTSHHEEILRKTQDILARQQVRFHCSGKFYQTFIWQSKSVGSIFSAVVPPYKIVSLKNLLSSRKSWLFWQWVMLSVKSSRNNKR